MRCWLCAAMFGVLALAFGSAGWSTEPAPKPALRIVDLDPVKAKGTHFKRFERVSLRLVADGAKQVKVVIADRAGSFGASFGATVVDRCSSDFALVAVGARGSRAAAKVAQPLCPPALSPPGKGPPGRAPG